VREDTLGIPGDRDPVADGAGVIAPPEVCIGRIGHQEIAVTTKPLHRALEWAVFAVAVTVAGCSRPSPQGDAQTGRHRNGAHDGPATQRRFKDAEHWAKRFERAGRDEWQKPDHVLAVLGLAPDATVADIGSATGYFPVRFALAAPRGRVYGLDIEPDMVRYLNERATNEGLPNLQSILAAKDDPRIPQPVDLIFLCNTYHHIADRVRYFRSRLADLRPGGRLAIVDFKPGDLPVGPPADHKIPPDQVVSELNEAGYQLDRQDDGLPYQFFYIFTAHDGD
jgi:SAM-dependent methyltransferase